MQQKDIFILLLNFENKTKFCTFVIDMTNAKKDKRKQHARELLKFWASGVASFFMHNVVYLMLLYLGTNASVAYALGFVAWMTTNFLLSNYFTFRTRPSVRRAIAFCISAAIFFAIQFVGFAVCQRLDIHDALITPIVYSVAFPFNFLMVRYAMRK
jgi:putative flippase GtrA